MEIISVADYATLVFDSVLSVVDTMSATDAKFAVSNFPTRYSYVTSPLAVVPTVAGAIPSIPAPSTAQIAAAVMPTANFRNIFDGGDFATNPWQRGTSFTAIANTATYTADRWVALGGASSSISVSKQAISAGTLPSFVQALQFGRANANSNTAAISIAQIVESFDAYRMQGQYVTLSFWAQAGALFSSLNNALTITLATGTTADQGNAGFFGASWAGYAAAPVVAGGGITLTTSWQRYFVTYFVPSNAAELGVSFGYTPVGTAGATDFFQLAGVQLEVGTFPSAFEHLEVQAVLEMCQRYAWVINEPASGIAVANGYSTATTTANINVPLPVQMRAAPAISFGGSALSATTWKVGTGATSLALSTPFMVAGTGHNPFSFNLTATTAASQTAGQGIQLWGAGGGGSIIASADL